ncbi:hypothetical protein K4F52_007596 [Lecanicillium sp. MT-2017a]|nr:hypothetical protein K4F52_007596 [Lecanicillium sp. MT-2017a]
MCSTTSQRLQLPRPASPKVHSDNIAPTALVNVDKKSTTAKKQQRKQSPSDTQLQDSSSSPEQQEPTTDTPLPTPAKDSLQKRTSSQATIDEPETAGKMSSSMSRDSSQSSKKCSPPPAKKAKSNSSSNSGKELDWSDVTDPEERRRIQNRIAQRKFREKARENKEKAERESRNQENAGNSYRIPSPNDISSSEDLSGLPWGSVNLSHVLTRGHELQSRRSSGRETTYVSDDNYHTNSHFGFPSYTSRIPHAPSYGDSSTGEDTMFDESPYLYPATTPMPTFSVR